MIVILILWRGGVFSQLASDWGIIQGESQRGKVVRVVDGDTVEVQVGKEEETVRMIGIDTPETVRPGVAVECGGPQASSYMKKLLPGGTPVRVVSDPTQDATDTYGRTLAYLYPLRSQESYGEQIVKAGWAEVYVFNNPGQENGEYERAQEVAKKKERGVWGLCGGDFHSAQ